jgi:hypothetical protein
VGEGKEDKNMNAIGWIALGGGALVVADMLGYINIGSWFTSTTGTTTTGTSSTPGASTSQTTGTTTSGSLNTPSSSAVYEALTNLLGQNQITTSTLQSPSQWNYYYAIVAGTPGPDPSTLFPGVGDNGKFTFAQYWAAMNAQGISGLRGLGLIAHHVNPYTLGPRAVQKVSFGAGLAPTGPETMIRRVN